MATIRISHNMLAAVASGATFTVAYPDGLTQSMLVARTSTMIVLDAQDRRTLPVAITPGGTSITVTAPVALAIREPITLFVEIDEDYVVAVSQGLFDDDAAMGSVISRPAPIGGIVRTSNASYANGDRGQATFSALGRMFVDFGSPTLPVLAAQMNADALATTVASTPVGAFNYLYNGTTWDRGVVPNATSRLVSAANSNNATVVKASAGKLHRVSGFNAGIVSYLKFYNKATAPTVGTDTPVLTEYLPANTRFEFTVPNGGQHFSSGIGYGIVTGGADADNTAVAAGAVLGLNVVYS